MGGGHFNMKIIFFGTPSFVLPILEKLHKEHEIVLVITQEPKPAGRDQKLNYSAVDEWAFKRKIDKQFDFENLPQADLGVCAAFGKIIPESVINHFKYGLLNIHPSLLPTYRGASPIQTAIANCDNTTGVTIIKMDQKMDHGPIVTQFKEEILKTDTFESLATRLFERSADVITDLIEPYVKNKINIKEQDHEKATFTKLISKEDGFVDLKNDPAKKIEAKYRAYSPWPGIWTKMADGRRLKIISCHLSEDENEIILDQVQLEGKNPVSWKQFISAYKI